MLWNTFSALSLLSLAATSVSAKSFLYGRGAAGIDKSKEHASDIIPGRFIVEFQSTGEDSFSRTDPVAKFYDNLKRKGINAKAGKNFTSNPIFEGTAFEINDKIKPEDILAFEEVKNIWPLHKIPLPKVTFSQEAKDAPTWTSHANTRVLDLHDKGYLGEGVVVAIVDTGIDYTHPALGGGVGEGHKVLSGYDIAGDDWIPGNPTNPDDDIQDCHGHGTHVSGIVAGEPADNRFISVAPKAKLRGYKVFGCGGSTDESLLIEAFVRAYLDGVDVINCSIGGPNGWYDGPWQLVADRVAKLGVFVAISAGNFGGVGPWFASSGSSGTDVLAVGSIDNEELYVNGALARISGNETLVKYSDDSGIDGWNLNLELPVYATSNDTRNPVDACEPLPDDTPDLSKYVVVIRRGTCNFSVKETNAVAKGAKYIFFYTDDRPVVLPTIEQPKVEHYAMISAEDGARLVNAFFEKKEPTLYFPHGGVGENNTITGGKMSQFSEWGPTYDGFMKPEIAAPGGMILSTYPVRQGSYAIASGTSMSSPYVAGIAALYFGKYGGRTKLGSEAAVALKNRIIASGSAILWNNGNVTDTSRLAPIAQQGGGYVDAYKVLEYKTSVSPAKLELNDTANFIEAHSVNVKNDGLEAVIYTLSHNPAATFYTFDTNSTAPKSFPPSFADAAADVKFSASQFAVPPGSTNTFKVTFTPPSGLDVKRFPVYGGKIVLSGTNGETLELPYQGVVGNSKDQKIWASDWNIPEISNDADDKPLTGPTNFTFKGTDRPGIVFVNDWGSREIRVDIVEYDYDEMKDFKYPRVAGKNKYVGSIITTSGVRFPMILVSRHNPNDFYGSYSYYLWAGILDDGASGKKIAPGKYKINVRALKVFGKLEVSEDWQSVFSPVITVLETEEDPGLPIPSESDPPYVPSSTGTPSATNTSTSTQTWVTVTRTDLTSSTGFTITRTDYGSTETGITITRTDYGSSSTETITPTRTVW